MSVLLKMTGLLPLSAEQEVPAPPVVTPLPPKETKRKSKELKQKNGEPTMPD